MADEINQEERQSLKQLPQQRHSKLQVQKPTTLLRSVRQPVG